MTNTASKTTLVIDRQNPRFEGMDMSPMDVTPYGDAIDRMFDSMVSFYGKTGRLLMQPVAVVEDNGNMLVRAGWTRAITFITRYDELCAACGVSSLELPVTVFTGEIDTTDSIMENLMRTDQHYVSTAFCIKSAIDLVGHHKVAKQLGMPVDKVIALGKLATKPAAFIEKCYTVITEKAALKLLDQDDKVLTLVADYIDREGVKKVQVGDADRLVLYVMSELPEWCPIEAFSYHSHISKQDWIISDGMNYYYTDAVAMKKRAKDYWTIIADKVTIKDSKVRFSSSYRKVPMGTHPKEVAVWDYRNEYLEFYLSVDDINKANDPLGYSEEKQALVDDRTKQKQVAVSEKNRLELMREQVGYKLRLETDDEVLENMIKEHIYYRLTARQLESLNKVTGTVVTIANISECTFGQIGKAMLHGDVTITANHKSWLKDNGVVWDDELKKIAKIIENDKNDVKVKGTDAKASIDDTITSTMDFLVKMMGVINYDMSEDLISTILNRTAGIEMMKYVAKGLHLPATKDVKLMSSQLSATVGMMIKGFGIDYVDMAESYEVLSLVNSMIDEFAQIHPSLTTVTHVDINYLLVKISAELEGRELACDTIVVVKHKITGLYNYTEEVSEFYKQMKLMYINDVHGHLVHSLSMIFLDAKGKVRILG